ncbi:cysteine hydrolase family protein [Martelella sp. HB161492]|uniref:cysteine hydrolase family protein n=1 Tax=Martelella sp. HB161492 TaxID=2720726 RepID=UPI0015900520|nr:cysteine hydrolase family protein [Martelella sp. HB161492]
MTAADQRLPLGTFPQTAWDVSAEEVILSRQQPAPRLLSVTDKGRKITLDLNRTGMIVVDMQNDFCHPDGWLASIGVDVAPARQPIEPLIRLLPLLRQAAVPVIWLNWGNRPDRANLPPSTLHVYKPTGRETGIGDPLKNGANVLEKDSWAAAVVDELVIEASDICVDKYRMSGFQDTALDSILRNLGLTTLLFAGVNADQCVLCTLQDANFLGYDCLMVEDCSATTSPAFCMEATLYNTRQCFGFVCSSDEIVAGLS